MGLCCFVRGCHRKGASNANNDVCQHQTYTATTVVVVIMTAPLAACSLSMVEKFAVANRDFLVHADHTCRVCTTQGQTSHQWQRGNSTNSLRLVGVHFSIATCHTHTHTLTVRTLFVWDTRRLACTRTVIHHDAVVKSMERQQQTQHCTITVTACQSRDCASSCARSQQQNRHSAAAPALSTANDQPTKVCRLEQCQSLLQLVL